METPTFIVIGYDKSGRRLFSFNEDTKEEAVRMGRHFYYNYEGCVRVTVNGVSIAIKVW